MTRALRLQITCAFAFLLLVPMPRVLSSQQKPSPCDQCAAWNAPQTPFRIYGNTYYVGPHGLSSILIASDAGLVLIDGALSESAPSIAANIRSLGFRIQDVKLILNSHVHFDHAGGIAELQRMSGAEVLASPWSAKVLSTGSVDRADPQYGSIRPIARVARVRTLLDGEVVSLGQLSLTAHFTPGHTPGGTSWTWTSCEANECLGMVYADSLSPVSTQGFKFTASREYPNAIQDFEKSFAFLNAAPCNVLVTPHPDASGFWDGSDGRLHGVLMVHPMVGIDPDPCRPLADSAREQLRKRIESETAH